MVVAIGLYDVLEADAKHIAKMARETFEKYALFFVFFLFLSFIFQEDQGPPILRLRFCFFAFNNVYGVI
jgi:hypothetical protein